MRKYTQTFSKGISQDVSTNKYPNDSIYWAQNFRLVSKDGLATGALTNVDGTVPKLNFGGTGEITISGHCLIRDTLVAFVDTSEGGKIYTWEYNTTDFEESPTIIYHDENLDFSSPVIAVGRYETPSVQKVYFTDGETYFKHLNIIPEEGGSYPLTYDLDSLDLVSDVTFSTMDLTLNTGGSLKAGKIQYAYQLYNKRGSESSISPESQLIALTNSSDTTGSSLDYKGDDVGTVVNKSVEVTVENIDPLFERIRLFALEYTVFNQTPAIRIVGEFDIDGSDVSMLDSGQSIGGLTLEEFRIIQNDLFPKSIDVKDNILFGGNITQNDFYLTNEEFDARVFRFNASDTARVYDGSNPFDITYSAGNLSTLPAFSHEAYNDFNSVESVYATTASQETIGDTPEQDLYKYNPATSTLGGYGTNISYEFTTNRVLLDEGVQSNIGFRGIYPSQICEVSTRENYSNPFTKAGYQRDEVYRFGFVPIDKKGREGFTMWIGDIKFPNNTELPFIEYSSNKTYANILGINFTVNIPVEVKEKISGYRIVRVNRTTSDKTIIAQGVVGYLANGGPDSSDKYQMMSQASVPLIGDMYNETSSYGRTTLQNAVSDEDEYTRKVGELLRIESEDGLPGFNPKYIEFTSAETAFNKTNFEENNAFIEAFGILDENDATAISGPQYRVARNRNQLASDKFKGFRTGSNNKRTRTFLSSNKTYIAKEFRGASTDPDNDVTVSVQEDGRIFNNKTSNLVETTSGHDYRRYGLRGTFNLCVVDADDTDINTKKLPLGEFYSGNNLEVVVGNYKVNKGKSAYGGTTFEARSYNTYYPVSEFIDKDTTSVDVYDGDTYISFFSYARSLYGGADPEDGDTIESYVFFPVETGINLELRSDQIQSYINWGYIVEDDAPNHKISETVQQGVLNYGTSYPQELGDLYTYNSAYSSITKGKEYIAEPFDFTQEEIFDTRIVASDTKINGEYIDSWTKFKSNIYLDADSKHGAITKIVTFKNQLFGFQPTAVGIAAVNQRSLVQDEQTGGLTVGVGGILNRYDYITDKSGSEFYEGIVVTDNFLFYADGRRKRINKLVPGKEEAISVIKGVDSTLDKKAFNTVVAGFDRGYNEAIFSIDGDLTLAFNEISDGFTSSYTVNPKLFITINKDLFSVGDYEDDTPWLYRDLEVERVGYIGNTDADPEWDYILIGGAAEGSTLFKHNAGNPGDFYGQDGIQDSYLTLILNPERNNVCKFDTLDLRTESTTTSGVDDVDDIFYRLEASNNYQEITRELSFLIDQTDPNKGYKYNTGSIKRIGRIWRTPIMATPPSGSSYSRIMDTYVKVTLRYNNSGNTFRVHDITVFYRPTSH